MCDAVPFRLEREVALALEEAHDVLAVVEVREVQHAGEAVPVRVLSAAHAVGPR